MPPKEKIRVRFAPSPTGLFHLGSARTALFNWLFVKNAGGRFILRLEDTDIERSKPEFENDIYESLKWLGLLWDEGPQSADSRGPEDADFRKKYRGDYGPYRQSERTDIYEKYIGKLLDENKAYYCFCSREELETERQAMLAQGLAPRYGGRCGSLPQSEVKEKLNGSVPSVIRFRTPNVSVSVNDAIRGKVAFNLGLLGDIVIAKNLKSPLYNLAVVIDDYEMKISHVIRGEDHLPNAPKQIALQEGFGFNRPHYAHLPLILSKDRGKLSKRYAETSLSEYSKSGYLKEAMINFLSLLGWHPEKDREVLTVPEIIEEFSLKRVGRAGAVLDLEKLNWLNAQHIKTLDDEELAERLLPFVFNLGWGKNKKFFVKVVGAEKERIKKLSDFPELASFFFKLPDYQTSLLIWQKTSPERIADNFESLISIFKELDDAFFTKAELEEAARPLIEKRGKGEVLWPLRAALSGKEASPGPFEMAEVLGKTETLGRIRSALAKLKT